MLRRLPKHHIRKGMFIESLECPDTEFSGRRFLVETDETLRAVLATSAAYALVNPRKSTVDIDGGRRSAALQAEEHRRTTHAVHEAAGTLRDSFEALRTGEFQVDRLGPVADELAERIDSSPDIFLKVTRLKTKDEGTYMHSLAVGALMMRLGRSLGFGDDPVRELGVAGLLHDIGKLLVPNAILNKDGKLEAEERRMVRNHPELGYRLLKEQGEVSETVLAICRHHHEALDGTGYPAGLTAERIGPEVRLATVCDVFEALTSERPYKRAWTTADALAWMFERKQLFDQRMVVRLGGIFTA